ncbi:MAG: response regulator transcription factor [Anaerolineae bacterium]|nr:response regulator transcription factor [Anaerolineae bacterium]
MNETILVVDDEPKITTFVRAYLEDSGYRVVTASDGQEALFAARHEKPDLVILDLMMPKMDGWAFIRQYRQERNTPIIVLTARVEESDQILGLELGADDYVTKPFSPRTLVARVRAVLRRAGDEPVASSILRSGDLALDREAHTVTLGNQPVELTPTEFNLLAVLMGTPNRAFARSELLDQALGDEAFVYDRTIDVHIKNLRRKIEPDPANPRYVLTVRGVGYRFGEGGDA